MGHLYTDDQQQELHLNLMESLVQYADQVHILAQLIRIAFHLCRYSYSEESRINCLDLLALIRDAKLAQVESTLHEQLFPIFLNITLPKEFILTAFHQEAIKSFMGLINSPFDAIKKQLVLCLVDTKTFTYHNLTHLLGALKADEPFLTAVCQTLHAMMVEGPTVYPRLSPESAALTSDDLCALFFNLFVNGELGLDRAPPFLEVNAHIYRILKGFLATNETTLYHKHLAQMSAKVFLKQAQKFVHKVEGALHNQSCTEDDAMQWVCDLETTSELISLIHIEKLTKTKGKLLEGIDSLKEHLLLYSF